MKIFLERNKTFLPRIDIIYFVIRGLTLLGLFWFILAGSRAENRTESVLWWIVATTYMAHLAIFYISIRRKFDVSLAYLSAILYDLLFIPLYIISTGGINSSFYLLYYLSVSVAAYLLNFWIAGAFVTAITVMYGFLIWREVTLENSLDLSIRIGLLWALYIGIGYVSDYLRKSETRLIKLFDTLNMRTQELERSQAQLEMIYENTRILAAILDTDGVVREIMRIMGSTLQYQTCGVIFRDKWGNAYYRARSVDGKQNFHLKAIDRVDNDIVRKAAEQHESIRLKDIKGRDDYQPLNDQSHSVMIVPMTSHGHSSGVLVAEHSRADQFKERDVQFMSIVARSAALALENAELHKRTEELTTIDELTETYNYRYFIQKLQEEKKRAMRYDLPVSLIMVDIDWFKKLNDTYGHEVGNVVLKELSRIIKKCIRDVDIFARYGGEEFVIILPQTPQSEAAAIGERIREAVESMIIDAGNSGKLKITVSVGVSSFPENGKSQEELVSIADQALYRAKGSGKNLVCTI
ncbi:MAG: sensor domain-containing diguanylate cyclase [Candidatus Zixiibacteriota bacterium]